MREVEGVAITVVKLGPWCWEASIAADGEDFVTVGRTRRHAVKKLVRYYTAETAK